MVNFFSGFTPESPEECPEYLQWLSRRLEEAFGQIVTEPVTASTTDLTDAGAGINVSDLKRAGYMVYNTTDDQPVWATGSGPTDTWVYADGTTAHTPS